jgi:phage-related protein
VAGRQSRRPINTRPLTTIANGVAEIRVRDDKSNQYRVIYITKIAQTVHVLHAFQKKSQQTPKADLNIATDRLKELEREHGQGHRK